ncbi:hypothetical protein V5O48_018200 [Marasmius crinis-equi]|uniref:Uncharacterized protein n=1 Tax=Marasmius crinis-equi TaxID=585013 RepID=A0ABR3ELU3_9AGAR
MADDPATQKSATPSPKQPEAVLATPGTVTRNLAASEDFASAPRHPTTENNHKMADMPRTRLKSPAVSMEEVVDKDNIGQPARILSRDPAVPPSSSRGSRAGSPPVSMEEVVDKDNIG